MASARSVSPGTSRPATRPVSRSGARKRLQAGCKVGFRQLPPPSHGAAALPTVQARRSGLATPLAAGTTPPSPPPPPPSVSASQGGAPAPAAEAPLPAPPPVAATTLPLAGGAGAGARTGFAASQAQMAGPGVANVAVGALLMHTCPHHALTLPTRRLHPRPAPGRGAAWRACAARPLGLQQRHRPWLQPLPLLRPPAPCASSPGECSCEGGREAAQVQASPRLGRRGGRQSDRHC